MATTKEFRATSVEDQGELPHLLLVLVRPYGVYWVQCWIPQIKMGFEKQERNQQRAPEV